MLFCIGMLCFSVIFSENDRKKVEFDIKQPRFLLMYIAMSLSILCLGYGLYQFFALFVIGESVTFYP